MMVERRGTDRRQEVYHPKTRPVLTALERRVLDDCLQDWNERMERMGEEAARCRESSQS